MATAFLFHLIENHVTFIFGNPSVRKINGSNLSANYSAIDNKMIEFIRK